MSNIVGANLAICNTQETYNKIREEKDIRYIEDMRKNYIRCNMETTNIEKLKQCIKKINKIGFINQFIDEIPELSDYDAAQLKKKLGDIYVEWNDE